MVMTRGFAGITVGAREAALHPTVPRTAPTENDLPTVSSAEGETLD